MAGIEIVEVTEQGYSCNFQEVATETRQDTYRLFRIMADHNKYDIFICNEHLPLLLDALRPFVEADNPPTRMTPTPHETGKMAPLVRAWEHYRGRELAKVFDQFGLVENERGAAIDDKRPAFEAGFLAGVHSAER